MINIYFAARQKDWAKYETPIRQALDKTGLEYRLSPDCAEPSAVDYIIYAPGGTLRDFSPFTRAKAVLSLWAGVERIVSDQTLTQPLVRMVNPGMTEGMVEYVVGHVLRHHLGMDAHITRSKPEWNPVIPPLARDRKVGVLGLGALGGAAASALRDLHFDVIGWSRRAKNLAGINCLNGENGLAKALSQTEILVLLLPLTPDTENLLDERRLALMPEGAVIINPGRGPLIDDHALLAALDSGQIGHATLDVFRQEPLPQDHPYWHNPRVTVTPHIASDTRPDFAGRVIAESIRRGESGEPFLNVVDRKAAY